MKKIKLFLFAAGLVTSAVCTMASAETAIIPHPFTVGKIGDQFQTVYFTDKNIGRETWKENYPDGQRLLDIAEWEYVLKTRDPNGHSADQLRGWATIIKDGESAQNIDDISQLGLVLLPDDWGYTHHFDNNNNAWCTDELLQNPIFNLGNTFANNVFTQAELDALQQAGAVFLPCETKDKVYGSGDYWSSTKNGVGGISYAFFQTSSTTPASETFQINDNGMATEERFVRLVQDHVTITLDENINNSALLSTWKTNRQQVNVQLGRSLVPEMYNTFCLPFDLNAKEVKDVFGNTTKLAKFTSGTLSGDKTTLNIEFEDIDLSIDNASAIEAGTPYLIQPTNAVANPIFYNRIIEVTAADGENFSPQSVVAYLGIINPHHLTGGDKRYLFLQANNTLTWSKEGDTSTMKGMRGYFYVPQMADGVTIPSGCPARLSVRPAPQTPTASEVVRGAQCTMHSEKYIYNNRVVIIRNGEMRDIFGNIIK